MRSRVCREKKRPVGAVKAAREGCLHAIRWREEAQDYRSWCAPQQASAIGKSGQ